MELASSPRNLDTGEHLLNIAGDSVKHELLTSKQEVELARRYKLLVYVENKRVQFCSQEGRNPTFAEIGQHFNITAQEVERIFKDGELAKDIFTEANMRLVYTMVKSQLSRGVTGADLLTAGIFGLQKAIAKFDGEKGFRFSTYASWWIKQALSRTVANKSRLMRMPAHLHAHLMKIHMKQREFNEQHNRYPTEQEIVELTGLSPKIVRRALSATVSVISADAPVYARNGAEPSSDSMESRLVSTEARPAAAINENDHLRSSLRGALVGLTSREADVLTMRYGLLDGVALNAVEVGKEIGVSKERVRQIETKALSKLRTPEIASMLKDLHRTHSSPKGRRVTATEVETWSGGIEGGDMSYGGDESYGGGYL